LHFGAGLVGVLLCAASFADSASRRYGEGYRGKATVKVLPTPVSDAAQIRPPWASTSMREM
jgi:hypothetical protein